MGKQELQGGAEVAVEWGGKNSKVGWWELQDGAARATGLLERRWAARVPSAEGESGVEGCTVSQPKSCRES